MSKIYGAGSTRSFDDISLSGGKRRRPQPKRKMPRVKYLDTGTTNFSTTKHKHTENHERTPTFTQEYKHNIRSPPSWSLHGGAAKSVFEHIYPSALYIPDSSIEEFSSVFLLKYLFSHAHKNSIFLIPSKKELQRLKKEFDDKLKAEKIPECTPEASKYAAKTPLLFKAYILDVFGENENDGQPYHVDPNQITSNEVKVVQRTNRLNQKCKVETGKNKMYVYFPDKPNEKAECTVLGIASGNVIVAKCDLPNVELGTAHNHIITANMSGGNVKKVLRQAFLNFVHKYNDVDRASYEFVAAVGAANKNRLKELADYYSGNYVHTAFSIITDGKNFNVSTDPSAYNSHAVHSALINLYRPKRSAVNNKKAVEVINNIIRQSSRNHSGISSNTAFVKMLNKMYSTTSAPKYMLKADIATSICESCEGSDAAEHALNVVEEMDNAENESGKSDSYMNSAMLGGSKHDTTPLINAIGHALLRSPFTGFAAREHVPMLYKSVSKSTRNNAFDDNISHDKESSSMFQYLDAEGGENGGADGGADVDLNVTNEEDKPKPTKKEEPATEEPAESPQSTEASNGAKKKHNSIDISTFF